jgi:hypothetical protein
VIPQSVGGAHDLADRRLDEDRPTERLERHPPDPVREVRCRVSGDLERKPRLSNTAGPDDRHESMLTQQPVELGELAFATDQGRRRCGNIRPVQSPKRRKLIRTDLIEPLRTWEILEPVLTQIRELLRTPQQLTRPRGDKGLTGARRAASSSPQCP